MNMPAWSSIDVKKATITLGSIGKEREKENKNHHYAWILIAMFSSDPLISETIQDELE